MIVTPPIYTPVHVEEITHDGSLESISEETLRKIVRNSNWLIDLIPIGKILFLDINRFGVPIPNSTVWQECNGSEIVNPDSPLRTIGINQNFVPDLRDRYPRVSPDLLNSIAGSQIHNLEHTHGLGGPSNIGPGLDNKGDRRRRVHHVHDVSVQYDSQTHISAPAFVHFIAYMRVA